MSHASFLEGERTRLRPFAPGDVGLIHRWLNDEAVTYFMYYGQKPTTLDQAAQMMAKQVDAETNTVFMVEDKKGRPVGFAGLYDIHPTARKAEFRVLLGDRSVWNKGLGTEVTELLTWYGFDRLNLNRVWLGVTSDNGGAVRAYEKAGYRLEGTLRQDTYRNSRYYDSVRMGILRQDYYPALREKHARRFAQTRPAAGKKSRP